MYDNALFDIVGKALLAIWSIPASIWRSLGQKPWDALSELSQAIEVFERRSVNSQLLRSKM
jgi:hypothetical protein